MEVSKFWTKTKIIVLISILVVIGIIVGSIFLYRNSMRKNKNTNVIGNSKKLVVCKFNYSRINNIHNKRGF